MRDAWREERLELFLVRVARRTAHGLNSFTLQHYNTPQLYRLKCEQRKKRKKKKRRIIYRECYDNKPHSVLTSTLIEASISMDGVRQVQEPAFASIIFHSIEILY